MATLATNITSNSLAIKIIGPEPQPVMPGSLRMGSRNSLSPNIIKQPHFLQQSALSARRRKSFLKVATMIPVTKNPRKSFLKVATMQPSKSPNTMGGRSLVVPGFG
jgi:hypothetical protein